MPHFMIVLKPYINLLNFSWIKKKMSIFVEYGAFKVNAVLLDTVDYIGEQRKHWYP